jgi:hypothetical protein
LPYRSCRGVFGVFGDCTGHMKPIGRDSEDMSTERRRPGRHAKPTRRARATRDVHPARAERPAPGEAIARDEVTAGDTNAARHETTARHEPTARWEDTARPENAARRGDRAAIAVAGAAAGLVAISVVVFVGAPEHQGPAAKAAAARGAASKAAPAAGASRGRTAAALEAQASPAAAPGDPDEDPGAIAYYKAKDPRDEVVKHVDDVRWSGRYLRVYTDLKESDTHSPVALALCRWTSEYLTEQRGDDDPVVFVHAKKNDNGNVVLVNKLSAKDSCKSVETL